MFANSLRLSTSSRVLVLCALIFGQNFLSTELFSPSIVLLGLSVLIMTNWKVNRSYLKLVWPLLAVLFIGILGASDHESRNILRDIAFALTPIAIIFMGWWIAGSRDMWPLILKIMVTSGFVLAVVHLIKFAINPALLSADLAEVRQTVGGAGDVVVLAFFLGLFQKRFGLNDLFPTLLPRFIVMPVLLASFVLSYSRTEFMVAFMLLLALWGVLTKINSRMIIVVAVLIVGFFALALTTPKDEIGTFRSKLVRSVTEVAVSDYQDMSDINSNWRGFESYRVWASFSSGDVLQQMFGQGFGALVDLGFYMPLGGEDLRYIPIFHNGYAYILIKAGLLGLACYIFFYMSIIRIALRYTNSLIIEPKFLARLLLGCGLSLVLSMYVVGGMAEMHNLEFSLLLGYLVRRIGQSQAEGNRIKVMGIG